VVSLYYHLVFPGVGSPMNNVPLIPPVSVARPCFFSWPKGTPSNAG